MTKFTLLCTLIISTTINAQPNQYADFQRVIADQRSSAAYLENIESNARKPNVPYSPTGIDHAAFYNKVNKNALPPLSAEARAKLDVFLKKQKEESDKRVEAMLTREHAKQPFIDRFISAGFSATEAESLARIIIENDGSIRKDYAEYLKYAEYYEYYKAVQLTASFDELMLAISEFEYYAPGTAYEALQGLKQRFADSSKTLDVYSVARLARYFSENADFTRKNIFNQPEPYTIKMADEYFIMEDKYPGIAKPFLNMSHSLGLTSNPYDVKLDYLWRLHKNKDSKDRKKLEERLKRARQS